MPDSAPKPVFRIKLNLLYEQGPAQKIPLRFLKWLLSYGRLIVILVEIIVLITFGLRFKYDADLANIKENINREKRYLEDLSKHEPEIRMTQKRLQLVKQIYAASPEWRNTVLNIAKQMPESILLTALSVEQAIPSNDLQFKLTGRTNSVNDMGGFVNALKKEQGFTDVNIAGVSLDDGALVFIVVGLIK